MADLERRVKELAARVQRLEDELAIHRLIVAYGIAADRGDADGAAATFAEDGVYDVDMGVMRGRMAVADMLRGARHQAMVGRCAHQIGPAVIEIDGDCALATGYSRVYLASKDGVRVYRVSTNRWKLERRGGGWVVVSRTTRLLGHTESLMPFGG
jgi:ketosteroid isomerase-like protein